MLAELDRRGTTDERSGLRTGSWLAREASLPLSVARGRTTTARKLADRLPDVDRALTRGEITLEHAKVLADACNPRIVDEFAAAAGLLADASDGVLFERWRAEVQGVADRLDADGGYDPSNDLARNRLSVGTTTGDTTVVNGQLVGVDGLCVEQTVNAIADELFHQYRATVRSTPSCPCPTGRRCGPSPSPRHVAGRTPSTLERPPGRPPTSPWSSWRRSPMRCTARTGCACRTARPARSAATRGCSRSWSTASACHSTWVVPVGCPRPPQRRAAALRDGGCTFPGCPGPVAWNDLHHCNDWVLGGPTDTPLLCGLCRHHHVVVHRPGWQAHADPSGYFWFEMPSGERVWGQRHGRQRAGPPPP